MILVNTQDEVCSGCLSPVRKGMGWLFVGLPNPTHTGERVLCRKCNASKPTAPQAVAKKPAPPPAQQPTAPRAQDYDKLDMPDVRVAYTKPPLCIAEYDGSCQPVRAPSIYKSLGNTQDIFKGNGVHITKVPDLVERLEALGGKVRLYSEVATGLSVIADQLENATKQASERILKVREDLAAVGQALFSYQEEGVTWLSGKTTAILADSPGCIDGDSIVSVNRAGRTIKLKLSELCFKFNGGKSPGVARDGSPSEGKAWDASIPTKVRALKGGTFGLHEIVRVVDSGMKPVVNITLASGKTLRATPDHEILTTGGWKPAVALDYLDTVITNGKASCLMCAGTNRVSTYKYGSFPGYCKTCIYRYKRRNHTYDGGRSIDKDGYVRVTGCHGHHRARRGEVYEHIIVAEKKIGRPILRSESVHHLNHDRSDNRPENLEVMSNSEHARRHGVEHKFANLDGGDTINGGTVCFVPKHDPVVSVATDGEAHTYDIVCADPYRNFVANGVVVHNCGKTVQALMAAGSDRPIIVVCPASVKSVWVNECKKFRPDLGPSVLYGRNSFSWPEPGYVHITNYEILPASPAVLYKSVKKGKLCGKMGFPAACPKGCILILDEAHYVKGENTARSLNTEELVSIVKSNGGTVYALTGTPIMNHPGDLLRMLEVTGLLQETFGSRRSFNAAFGAKTMHTGYGPEVIWGKPEQGALDILKRVMLRREKYEVLKFLPTKRWEDITVDVDAPTKSADILKGLFSESELEGFSEGTSTSKEWSDHIMAARRELAEAKIPAMLELVSWHEDCDDPVVVFSSHRAPIRELQERDGWRVIFGDTSTSDRAEAIELFQAGKLKGIAATIQAGGVGITLTRGCNIIMVDRAWTPAANEQAEDRVCRIGQTRGVLITCLVANHEVDKAVARCLAKKRKIIDDSVKPNSGLVVNQEALRIRNLLERMK